MLGNMPNSTIYRRMDQYTMARTVPGVLVLHIDAPIYFANASYLRERYHAVTIYCTKSDNTFDLNLIG